MHSAFHLIETISFAPSIYRRARDLALRCEGKFRGRIMPLRLRHPPVNLEA
jgi:hypothetical protein